MDCQGLDFSVSFRGTIMLFPLGPSTGDGGPQHCSPYQLSIAARNRQHRSSKWSGFLIGLFCACLLKQARPEPIRVERKHQSAESCENTVWLAVAWPVSRVKRTVEPSRFHTQCAKSRIRSRNAYGCLSTSRLPTATPARRRQSLRHVTAAQRRSRY